MQPERFLERLKVLDGRWMGSGCGSYPTIDRFEYAESTQFVLAPSYPIIFYEQRTKLGTGEPSHWESGFWTPHGDEEVQVSNAQDSGRVEVLNGVIEETTAGVLIVLESQLHGNDSRLIRTRRRYELTEDKLTYMVEMETRTTDKPALQQHLQATLHRTST